MDENMDRYEELMQRHAAIAAQWMTFVHAAQNRGWAPEQLHSAGIVLGRSGTLAMRGRDEHGAVVLEMCMELGDDEVALAYVAPWIKELVA